MRNQQDKTMTIVRFTVRNTHLNPQPVTIGLPLPMSKVRTTDELTLLQKDGTPTQADFSILCQWTDSSIRWVLCTFITPMTNTEECHYCVTTGKHPADHSGVNSIAVDRQPTCLTISNDCYEVAFDQNRQGCFPVLKRNGKSILSPHSNIAWLDCSGQPLELISQRLGNIRCQSLSCDFTVDTRFKTPTGKHLNLQVRYQYIQGGTLRMDVEIHNPQRAQHKHGIWDMGDPGSINFNALCLQLTSSDKAGCAIRCQQSEDWTTIDHSASLFQASSGGARWDSINHCDASGVVRNKFKGYQFTVDNTMNVAGLRAEPTVRIIADEHTTCTVSMPEFWQNFPTAVSYSDNTLALELFPQAHGSPYEIQGGEKKTQTIFLTIAQDDLTWTHKPAAVTINHQDIIAADVLRYCSANDNTPYDRLLQLSLGDQTGIKAKREIIDEYGWRNFGDVYADHEALYHTDNTPFVSHYNNQYDPLFGFGRQFLLTGDTRWYALMHDLARHVIDIDIYHTDSDRPEYNNGLFWHTDHYVKAYTSSHRTYSRQHHPEDPAGTGGGGPGAEHCYTTGLALYYCLTGDQRAKTALIKLQQWISNCFEGNGSLLNFFFSLLKKDSKSLLALARGKKTFRYLYPLDRGTGNYMRALMDCYEIQNDYSYISRVEHIIKNTIGPDDDISLRNLDDLEGTWHYTVFLQETIRYLDTKRHLNQYDEDFVYARKSVLHYAQWMLTEESPYLSRPEQLEYANHTWVAQEIRKASIFYAAYRYSIDDREPFRERAKYFRDYVVTGLQDEPDAGFARIQIILMQNHGPHQLMDQQLAAYTMPELPACPEVKSLYTPLTFTKCVGRRFIMTLMTFRPRKELAWIKPRVI